MPAESAAPSPGNSSLLSDSVPVSIDILEAQKENIQPIKEGRSAASLARVFAIPPAGGTPDSAAARERLIKERDEFEHRIRDAHDLDDPLEPYLDLIHWTITNFPQGNSAESRLSVVLERCAHEFQDAPYVRDDPRYLKVWLRYMTFSDDPRGMFLFLARKEIGRGLATFYEEYARYLEATGLRAQAKQTYEVGLQRMARPAERLRRNYLEFCRRLEANPPDPAEQVDNDLEVVRPALALKEGAATTPEHPQQGASQPSGSRESRTKMGVFSDPTGALSQHQELAAGGWVNVGTLAQRRKENVMEATPWVGQTLQSATQPKKHSKMFIFRDKKKKTQLFEQPEDVPGKRPGNIAVALEYLQDSDDEELSLEEVLARSRGMLPGKRLKSCSSEGPDQAPSSPLFKADSPLHIPEPQQQKQPLFNESVPITDSPSKRAPASPTMTLMTKAATEDVYEMFNQPLKDSSDDDDEDVDDDDNGFETENTGFDDTDLPDHEGDDDDDDFTGKSTATFASRLGMPPRSSPSSLRANGANPALNSRAEIDADGEDEHDENQHVDGDDADSEVLIEDKICDPTSEDHKQRILEHIQPPLTTWQSFHFHPGVALGKKDALKRAFTCKPNKGEGASVAVEYPDGQMYLLKSLLGQGGFGSVYLGETQQPLRQQVETTKSKSRTRTKKMTLRRAIKIEDTPNVWEFYILERVRRAAEAAGDSRFLQSVVRAHEQYLFKDESHLVMDYEAHGTVLDAVNRARQRRQSGTGALDEHVAMFVVVEVLRVVEGLHRAHIVHCDLKPDNVMLRIDRDAEEGHGSGGRLGPYKASGENGWAGCGVKVIDFGRGIDVDAYPAHTQFVATWPVDAQDCAEMQARKPWTYEPDYHGVAGLAHLMLFGKFLRTTNMGKDGLTGIGVTLKRYWATALWTELFEVLLNPRKSVKTHGEWPLTSTLRRMRYKFEEHLKSVSERRGSQPLRQAFMDAVVG